MTRNHPAAQHSSLGHSPQSNHGASQMLKSSGKLPLNKFEEKRIARRAKREHRATFPERWTHFIRTYFGDDPVEVAGFFGCDPDTAEGWICLLYTSPSPRDS